MTNRTQNPLVVIPRVLSLNFLLDVLPVGQSPCPSGPMHGDVQKELRCHHRQSNLFLSYFVKGIRKRPRCRGYAT